MAPSPAGSLQHGPRIANQKQSAALASLTAVTAELQQLGRGLPELGRLADSRRTSEEAQHGQQASSGDALTDQSSRQEFLRHLNVDDAFADRLQARNFSRGAQGSVKIDMSLRLASAGSSAHAVSCLLRAQSMDASFASFGSGLSDLVGTPWKVRERRQIPSQPRSASLTGDHPCLRLSPGPTPA